MDRTLFLLPLACLLAVGCVAPHGPSTPTHGGAGWGGPDPAVGTSMPAPGASQDPVCGAWEKQGAPSGNAPRYAVFAQPPAEAAARVARAVGDPLLTEDPDPARSDESALQWTTVTGGSFGVVLQGGAAAGFHWWAGEGVPPIQAEDAETFVGDVLEALGIPRAAVPLFQDTNPGGDMDLWFSQALEGSPVHGTGGTLRVEVPALTLWVLHDLAAARATVSNGTAAETAEAYGRCAMDESGRTAEEGYVLEGPSRTAWAVASESLVHRVTLTFSEPDASAHCAFHLQVDVDARTGVVLGSARPPCD